MSLKNNNMKKFILINLFLISTSLCQSQTVNDIPITEIDVEYLQIVGTSRLLSNKVSIEIDFGQQSKFFSSGKETQIKDVSGKPLIFNSMIDALNFMTSNGYSFVQAYAFAVDNQNVYHYLMKKSIPK